MLIPVNNIKLNIKITSEDFSSSVPVIFLHGFSGSTKDWNHLAGKLPDGFNPILIDVVGHGKSDSPNERYFYSAASIINQLKEIYKYLNLASAIIIGYSMGGRIAMNFAINNPELISGLILESTTAGIIDEFERRERIKKDEELAMFIEKNPIEEFVNYWLSLPLFESQNKLPKEIIDKIRESKLTNNRMGLANCLREFGTGIMPQLWFDLAKINCASLLITGEVDKKFSLINSKMSKIIKHSEHVIINGCGHNVHLEKPEVFLNLLTNFLHAFQQV